MMLLVRDRVGIEPRRQARRRTLTALRQSRVVVGVGVGMLILLIGVLLGGSEELTKLTGHPWSPRTFGILLGGAVVSVPWVIWTSVILIDGSWSWRIGAQAERWTSTALRALGAEWRFEYCMVFYGGKRETPTWITDIDCVAIGPGGVFAVSTKWTSDAWDLNDPDNEWVVAAATQAARNTDRLRPQILNKVSAAPVVPVVVCWGPQLEPIYNTRTCVKVAVRLRDLIEDVWVLHGGQSEDWLPLFSGDELEMEQIAEAHEVVTDWIARDEAGRRRTSRATAAAKSLAHRARLVAVTSTGVSAVAIAGLVAAATSRSALRIFDDACRLAGNLGAVVYLLLPVALSAGGGLIAQRARHRCRQAGLIRTASDWPVSVSASALAAWLLALVAVSTLT